MSGYIVTVLICVAGTALTVDRLYRRELRAQTQRADKAETAAALATAEEPYAHAILRLNVQQLSADLDEARTKASAYLAQLARVDPDVAARLNKTYINTGEMTS